VLRTARCCRLDRLVRCTEALESVAASKHATEVIFSSASVDSMVRQWCSAGSIRATLHCRVQYFAHPSAGPLQKAPEDAVIGVAQGPRVRAVPVPALARLDFRVLGGSAEPLMHENVLLRSEWHADACAEKRGFLYWEPGNVVAFGTVWSVSMSHAPSGRPSASLLGSYHHQTEGADTCCRS